MTKTRHPAGCAGAVLGDRIATWCERDAARSRSPCPAADYLDVRRTLRDDPALKFEQLIDLCGMDYSRLQGRRLGPALTRRCLTCCR
jgi:NADH:ubiquinone oxidoreductase subunit C